MRNSGVPESSESVFYKGEGIQLSRCCGQSRKGGLNTDLCIWQLGSHL